MKQTNICIDCNIKIDKRDNYTCQDCGQYGGTLNADHIVPFSTIYRQFLKKYIDSKQNNNYLFEKSLLHEPFWDINNGKTLCLSCHKIKTKRDKFKMRGKIKNGI